jgi:nucleotide-binding universal stress UspA family protein
MSYATIMIYVDVANTLEQQVRLSVSLADKFNAMLIGLSALAIRPPPVADVVIPEEIIEADIKEMRAKLAQKGSWFRDIAGAEHRKLEWRSMLDFPTEALAREARSADLVVIQRTKRPVDLYSSLDPGGAILKIGRPTLVVPNEASSLHAKRVVIGWKDTREARRVVQDALPFLHETERVTITEICQPGEEDLAQQHIDDVARYLERHKINSGPRIILHRKGSDAAQLIDLAQDEGADLLITGAYGHSRLGEWIFGGMTRELLVSCPIFCLMSH